MSKVETAVDHSITSSGDSVAQICEQKKTPPVDIFLLAYSVRGDDLEALKRHPTSQPPKEGFQLKFPLSEDGTRVFEFKRIVDREDFAWSKAGDNAFWTVQMAEGCERILNFGEKDKKYCGNEPTLTIDMDDWEGDLRSLPLCSIECKKDVETILNTQPRVGRGISINGFGRA